MVCLLCTDVHTTMGDTTMGKGHHKQLHEGFILAFLIIFNGKSYYFLIKQGKTYFKNQ